MNTSAALGASAIPQLTYGIEIEFSFLVNQEAIEKVSPSDAFLRSLRESVIDQQVPERAKRNTESLNTMRRIYQCSKILEQKNILHNVLNEYGNYTGTGFNDWSLTYDRSADLDEHRYEHLPKWTHGLIVPHQDARGRWSVAPWKHAGLELVSRILDAPVLSRAANHDYTSLTEVEAIYRSLSRPLPGQDYTLPYLSLIEVENSGLHVHVGVPPIADPADSSKQIKQSMSLDLVKHIAYLVLAYEDVISSVHHPERRGYALTKTDYMARTNRLGLLNTDHICTPMHTEDLKALRTTLFESGEIATIQDLIVFMDNLGPSSNGNNDTSQRRYKFVNFENLGEARIGTIEFRQHHGTHNPEDVKQWIVFVTQLVYLAARRCATAATAKNAMQSTRSARRAYADLWSTPAHIHRRAARTPTAAARERDLTKSLCSLVREAYLDKSRETYWLARQKSMQVLDRAHRSTARGTYTCGPCGRAQLNTLLAAKDAELDRLYAESGIPRPRNTLRFPSGVVALARESGAAVPDTSTTTSSERSSSSSSSSSASMDIQSTTSPAQQAEVDADQDILMSDTNSEDLNASQPQPPVRRSTRLARLAQHRNRRQQRR